jgi:hypothetical protein
MGPMAPWPRAETARPGPADPESAATRPRSPHSHYSDRE